MMTTENSRPLTSTHNASNDTRQTGLNNNDLIIGPSGSGKTGGYVIPNILQTQGSIVVADTKSNLYRTLGPSLRARGYSVYVVDFVNPEQSSPYNPLDYIAVDERTGALKEQDIMSVANILVPLLDKHEPFWEMSARTVVACLIAFAKEAFPPEEQTLGTVNALFKLLGNQYASQKSANEVTIPFLEEWAVVRPESFATKKYYMFKSVLAADRTWSCISQSVATSIDVFDFKEANQMFGVKPDFRLEELGHRKCAVFLNISDTDRTLDKIVNLFYTQALQALCREADRCPESRLPVPVRIILDDFATNAYIPDFDRFISVIRSREIAVSIILQSLTQLETMYEHPAAMTIVNNCDHILYLGGNDLKTAEFVSTYADKPLSKVLCMALDKACLITRGQKAEIADKIKPYSYEIPSESRIDLPMFDLDEYVF